MQKISSTELRSQNEKLIADEFDNFTKLVADDKAALAMILAALIAQKKLHCDCGPITTGYRQHHTNDRIIVCNKCKQNINFTQDTVFWRVRCIRAYLGAIWLLERGAELTTIKIQTLFDVWQSTGFEILHKLNLVINRYMDLNFAEKIEHIDYSIYTSAICRRSVSSLADLHPSKEFSDKENHIEENQNAQSDTESAENEHPDTSISENEQSVLEVITNSHEPISLDEICNRSTLPANEVLTAVTMLEFAQRICRAPGQKFKVISIKACVTLKNNLTDDCKSLIQQILFRLRAIHHGVSFKYLQLHLAANWCFRERNFWTAGKLLTTATTAEIMKVVSLSAYKPPQATALLFSADGTKPSDRGSQIPNQGSNKSLNDLS